VGYRAGRGYFFAAARERDAVEREREAVAFFAVGLRVVDLVAPVALRAVVLRAVVDVLRALVDVLRALVLLAPGARFATAFCAESSSFVMRVRAPRRCLRASFS
jgi:hypothetical protein